MPGGRICAGERGLLCSEKPNDLLGKPVGFETRRLALLWNPTGSPGGSLGFLLRNRLFIGATHVSKGPTYRRAL